MGPTKCISRSQNGAGVILYIVVAARLMRLKQGGSAEGGLEVGGCERAAGNQGESLFSKRDGVFPDAKVSGKQILRR